MTRPIYEKPEDLAKEREIIDRWCVDYGRKYNAEFKAFKLPVFRYIIDFAITDCNNNILAWAEVKARDGKDLMRFKDYWISSYKMMKGLDLARFSGKPFFLIGRFLNNDIYFCNFSKVPAEEYKFGINGRADRNDKDDYEPVIYIPTKYFVKL